MSKHGQRHSTPKTLLDEVRSGLARFLASRRIWQCRVLHPHWQFSINVGTIFDDSPLGLEKWLRTIWTLANSKNGISSYEVDRALGVTQKIAWFMLHRIRMAMQIGALQKLSGWAAAHLHGSHDATRTGATEAWKAGAQPTSVIKSEPSAVGHARVHLAKRIRPARRSVSSA